MIDKIKVARSFSRSAVTYDSVAYFQRDMGEALLSLMSKTASFSEGSPVCVDLGCGTGHFYSSLKSQYSGHQYVGIDIAEGMLQFVKQNIFTNKDEKNNQNDCLVCSDAENLPLAKDSVNLLFSNLALQWCESLPALFSELHRVLAPGSVFAFTTLGPGTLQELKQSWKSVDDLVHVNHFLPASVWEEAILQNDFTIECYQQEGVILKYESVNTLLRELKLLGAHNVNDGQRQTLTGRKRLTGLLAAYQKFFVDGYYPATYDVSFWVLKKF
ncbi:MAG: malonyl-ACP O-methyltransferase BioC [Cellvibrionaceae bacterium]